jgi:hypothetical protein
MNKLFPICACLILSACAIPTKDLTAGQIGCPASEVKVVSQSGDFRASSWVAACRGKTFSCSYTPGTKATCTEEIASTGKANSGKATTGKTTVYPY